MNKPIKLTSEIRDPNSLLNKFIIFKNNNTNYLFSHYIYKINGVTIFSYIISYYKDKIICNRLDNFYLENYNFDIQHSLINNRYNMYIL